MTEKSRKIRGRSLALGAAAIMLVGTLVGTPGADAQEASPPGTPELFNLEHVFNFNPGDHDPGIPPAPEVGSDLEFFTHTVPLRDYGTGAFVDEQGNQLPARGRPVMAERHFAVVGSYQRGGYVFDITDPENAQFVTQVTCRQPRNDVGIKKFIDPTTGETRVVLALTQQSGNPCGEDGGGVGVRVNTPGDLAGFFAGTQWVGTAPVAGQTADLVYAGTGCSPIQYAGVDVQGKIALVDKFVNADGVQDCPTFTFKQKMDSAELAGAIGLVQVDSDDAPSAGTAIESGIPGLEISNSDGAPIRDAVIAGTSVNVTLTDGPSAVPLLGEGSGGIGVFDITDPFEWAPMYRLRTGLGGVHNFAFHPTKPYGYVSNGALPGAINQIPIVDFTDLDDPTVLPGPTTEGGVHDVEFSLDGTRAYAASENNYRIYDTTDPASPELISRTPNVGSYAHGVFPDSDLELMVTNNESLVFGGFLAPGVCPGEGLASYDIAGANENQPVGPLGYYVPNVTGPSPRFCTSHFGRFAPGTEIMSIGWYVAGARVVDWSNPSNPVEVAGAVMPDMNTWAAKFYKGPYLYTGDIGRGFDVFRWSGDGPAPWVAEADLGITKSGSSNRVKAGTPLTYALEVTNAGPRETSGVTVVDRLPDGVTLEQASASQGSCQESDGTVTCDLGTLADGASASVTLDVTAPPKPTAITNTASVTGHLVDPDSSNNQDSATTKITGPPAGGGTAPEAIEPGCDAAWCGIQPGALLGNEVSGFCTMGFVFRDEDTGRLMVSTAAHCTEAVGERLHAEEAEETFRMEPEAFGTVVFRTDDLDFALIEVDAGREEDLSASVRHWTGPEGVALAGETAFGDEVMYYGYGFTFDLTPELRPRTGILTSHNQQEYQSNSAGMFGDSGAAVLHESGRALGLISRFNILEDGVSTDLGPTVEGMLNHLASQGWRVMTVDAEFTERPLLPV
ncbi:MAG: PA domain-containing protein [Actinomycetota bacterium]